MPALLWAKSRRPWRSTTCATSAALSSPAATSHGEERGLAARLLDRAHGLLAAGARALEVGDDDRRALRPKRIAQARPMPLAAPGDEARLALHETRHGAATLDQRGGRLVPERRIRCRCAPRAAGLDRGVADLARRDARTRA